MLKMSKITYIKYSHSYGYSAKEMQEKLMLIPKRFVNI